MFPRRYGLGARPSLGSLASFLDALHIPERLGRSLVRRDSPRTKTGNRSNRVALVWERIEGLSKYRTRVRWIRIMRRAAERRHLFSFLDGTAFVTLSLLLLFSGVGSPRRQATPPGEPLRYSVAQPAAAVSGRTEATQVVSPADVRWGDRGQVVEVRAADPSSVLIGYCRTTSAAFCQPVELAQADPPQPKLRFGVFRGFSEIRAIKIRLDAKSGMWTTGDGTQDVTDFSADALSMSGARFQVYDLATTSSAR